MWDRLDETIVAIASAPGGSPVGILRLSGPSAIDITSQLILSGDPGLSTTPGWRANSVELSLGDSLSVPAVIYLFRAPRSYTRQDVTEIHTIGSPPLLEMLRRRCVELGARPAQPGEFTARAFAAGAMDLAEAEAVAGVIRAETDSQLRASRAQLAGNLSHRVRGLRDLLSELLALVEAGIDFVDEPIEFITPAETTERLAEIGAALRALSARPTGAEAADHVPRILLLGPPNAGKSSLMNRLSETSRSICSATAGTTRDILSAPVRLDRGEALLLDSAGVDPSVDEILHKARALTLAHAEQVDLVCLVIDASDPVDEHFLSAIAQVELPSTILALNKIDLLDAVAASEIERTWRRRGLGPVVCISAAEGTGIDRLRLVLTDALRRSPSMSAEHAGVLNERQHGATVDALAAIDRAAASLADGTGVSDRAELLAFDLREALDTLGAITGEVTTEDMLGQVFARFCIGK